MCEYILRMANFSNTTGFDSTEHLTSPTVSESLTTALPILSTLVYNVTSEYFYDPLTPNMTTGTEVTLCPESLTAGQATNSMPVYTRSTDKLEEVSTHPDTLLPTTLASKGSGKLVSDDVHDFFEIMNFVILSGVISLLGTISNVINIVVFAKQGFSDTVNISLLGLAVSDLGALVSLLWMSVCFNPLFRDSGISFDSTNVQYLTAGWPHVCFARITSWITAWVTLERCLCIATPLKVKEIITPKRTVCVIVSVFVVMIACVLPVYFVIQLEPVLNERMNRATRTLTGLVYVDNGKKVENISFAINVFAQLCSFVLVIICTAILVQSLTRKGHWRMELTSNREGVSLRDKKLIKMVTLLAGIFIACFLPSAVNLIVMILTPEYSIVGTYRNAFQVGWSFLNTLEATNSSVNIFVYYNMSTRYRTVFKRMFFQKCQETRSTGAESSSSSRI